MGAVDQGMSHVQDRDSTSSTEPAKSGSHARDIRFAGAVSAGLVSAILVSGALLAPIAERSGDSGARERGGEVLTLQLPKAPRPDVGRPGPDSSGPREPTPVPGAGPLTFRPVGGSGAAPVPLLPGVALGGGGAAGGGDRTRESGVAGGAGAIADAVVNQLGADANEDGIPDQRWRAYAMDPLTSGELDLDGDGIKNGDELHIRTAPNSSHTNAGVSDGDLDFDRDGLRNGIEAKAGTKPWSADSNNDGTTDSKDDFDRDGLMNKTEQDAGTALDNPDSNGDGVGDAQDDVDGDGLTNKTEQDIGSNPALADSNGDGVADGDDDS
ncbi:MAG TPA: hypothetical protein VKA57_08855, partial [Solirubrobacteraceae bacterium]|nr:hypothetical protein [Solirubrobacteraceae bacterium]